MGGRLLMSPSSHDLPTPPAAPSGQAVALETRNLSRAVAGKLLVNGVNLQVRRGEVLAVVGPSGSGKSSLLRLMNRLDEPTSGTVYLAGQDYRQFAPRQLRRRVGMMMQSARTSSWRPTFKRRCRPA